MHLAGPLRIGCHIPDLHQCPEFSFQESLTCPIVMNMLEDSLAILNFLFPINACVLSDVSGWNTFYHFLHHLEKGSWEHFAEA